MRKVDEVDDQHYIFGTLLNLSNAIDTVLDRDLKEFDLTSKQWFLALVIDNLFDEMPSITEVSKAMGSSHQNVKQVALKLEKKGLLDFVKDPKDGRRTKLKLTEKSLGVWKQTHSKGEGFTDQLFEGIGNAELAITKSVLAKMQINMNLMEDDKIDKT